MVDANRCRYGHHRPMRWGRERELYRKIKTDEFYESDDSSVYEIPEFGEPELEPTTADMEADQHVRAHMVNFRIIYGMMQLIGITLVVLMCAWVSMFLGGVGVAESQLKFNWHPLLMAIGPLYMYGNSIVLYRGMRYARKKNLKMLHSAGFFLVMILTITGLVAVFDSHNYVIPPIPNLYSLHSWVGLSGVIMFGLQWVAGFAAFFYPQLRGSHKSVVLPYHVFFGLLSFVLMVAASLLGLSEKAFFHIKNIADLPHEGVLVNTMGILIIVFAGLVGFLVTKGEFKRQPLPEDAILLTGSDE